MATITGNNGTVTLYTGAAYTTIAAVRSFSVEMTADTIETTVMGQDVRSYVSGLSSFSGSADIYFDTSDFDTYETSFNPTAGLVGVAGVGVRFYIAENYASTSDYAFTGEVIVTGYTVNSSMDGMVEASISFQGTRKSSDGSGVTYSTTALT